MRSELQPKSMTLTHTKAGGCTVCGLRRQPKHIRDDWKHAEHEVPVVGITVKGDNEDDWRSESNTTICKVCMDNIVRLCNITSVNKLVSASIQDDRYIDNKEPAPEQEVSEDE